jgi:adenosine deaminase
MRVPKERAMPTGAKSLTYLLAAASLFASAAMGQAQPAERTARYMESVRQQPTLLRAFLGGMPKGGDLHNHLFGAIYAENLINYAADNGMCIDHTTSLLIAPPCDPCERYSNKPAISCAYSDHVLYNQIVDAWSMRNWIPGETSGHDHFFGTFDKFSPAFLNHVGEALAEEAERAANNNLEYLEIMHTADGMLAAQLGSKVGWQDNFSAVREKLLANGMKDVILATRRQLDADEARMRSLMKCGTLEAQAGCGVTIRYLYQVLRGLPRESVFAQVVLGFELAQADSRFVGLNLVMPEDWYVPMRDFDLHMHMLDYLHGVYPKVHISLHAGELALGLVPPEGLRFHIRESVEVGHAERIGHGVSVMHEADAVQLLRQMAQRGVLVEICLTSNDVILNVRGADHPLMAYRQHGVPVALATDDEGVSRIDMTNEYWRAARDYNLTYDDLKRLARDSLEHSFLPGASLWSETREFHRATACASDDTRDSTLSKACRKFLDENERARIQWQLEKEFQAFESKY